MIMIDQMLTFFKILKFLLIFIFLTACYKKQVTIVRDHYDNGVVKSKTKTRSLTDRKFRTRKKVVFVEYNEKGKKKTKKTVTEPFQLLHVHENNPSTIKFKKYDERGKMKWFYFWANEKQPNTFGKNKKNKKLLYYQVPSNSH